VTEYEEHEAAHRVRGAAAVVEELVPRLVAALHRVLAKSGKQVEEQLLGDLHASRRLAEGHEDRVFRLAAVPRVQPLLPLVELLLPHALVDRLVREVVGCAREGVEGVDVPALVPGHEEADREVLVMAADAGLAERERLVHGDGRGHARTCQASASARPPRLSNATLSPPSRPKSR